MTAPLHGQTVALAEGRHSKNWRGSWKRKGRHAALSTADHPRRSRPAARARLVGRTDRRQLRLDRAPDRRGTAASCGLCGARGKERRVSRRPGPATVTRGPKPGRALKEVGLAPTRVASTPTTEGVITALQNESLHGQTVGVQLYSEDNPPLAAFLRRQGQSFAPCNRTSTPRRLAVMRSPT